MKKLLLIILIGIFLIGIVSAYTVYTENNPQNSAGWTQGDASQTGKGGVVVKSIVTNVVTNLTTASGVTATSAWIHADSPTGTLVAYAPIVSNVATFYQYPNVTANRTYYFLVSSNGSAYADRYNTSAVDGASSGNFSWLFGIPPVTGANQTGQTYEVASIGFASNISVLVATPTNVILNSPANNSRLHNTSIIFNATITPAKINDINFNLTNATTIIWFWNGTLFNSTTISINGNATNTSTFNISNILYNNFTWNVLGVSGNGVGINSSFASANFTFNVSKIFEISQLYDSTTLEQTTTIFKMNVSIDSARTISYINLTYNNTNYTGTFISFNSTHYQTSATLTTPSVVADVNKTFNWTVQLDDGTLFYSTNKIQTVNNLGVDNCTTNTIQIFNYSMVNEETQSNLNPTTDNTSIKVDLSLYPNSSLYTPTITFSNYYNESTLSKVCINQGLGSGIFYINSIIEYDADGYSHEYYYIQNYSLNASLGTLQNITLYDLLDASASTFKITFKDSSFLAVADALLQIQRKYVDEGVFKTIEIPKTDTKGESIAHFQTDSAIYNIIVVKNGEILATFNDIRAVCQNSVIGDCQVNLNTYSSSLDTGDFTSLDDFSFTISYDNTTQTVSSMFSIPSGSVSTILLNVTLYDQIGHTEVCSNSLLTSSGTLSCVVPASYTNQTVVATIYKDGDFQGRSFIKIGQNPSSIYGVTLVFLSIFLLLSLIGIGVQDDPKITAVFLILGAIISIALNTVVSYGYFGAGASILWVITAIILILVKGGTR